MNNAYVLCYRRGPAWVAGKTVFEQPLKEHLAYMMSLKACGTLVLGGPFLDDTGGLVVVESDTLQAAQALAQGDPAIRDRVMVAEVHPWKIMAGDWRPAAPH
jgi:uncharacterized protein YciI